MADFLEQTREEITKRLKELEPLVDEHSRLQAAASALEDALGAAASAVADAAGSAARSVKASAAGTTRRRRRGRPPGSTSASKTQTTAVPTKKRGRPPGRPKKVGRPAGGKKVGRPAGSTNKAAAATAAPAGKRRRGGRPKGSGTRAAEALAFAQAQPGITIPELAAKMKIKQNYLYRVLPTLEQEGKIEKQGRGWYPKG